MKKFLVIAVLLVTIVIGACLIPTKSEDVDYLRLHIRANSNASVDQNVKYKIKDEMVDYLTPYFCEVKSKDEAINRVYSLKTEIEKRCTKILRKNGFSYSVNVKVANEYFPTRTYANTTLESGYYDAVIVELGDAVGDNWWCVMYPPLCFTKKTDEKFEIKYKSRLKEWFENLFN